MLVTDLVTYALLNKKVKSALSGVDHYEIDGLNLKIFCNDGAELTMTFPAPVELDSAEIDEDKHLILTLEDGSQVDVGELPVGASAYDIAVEEGFQGDKAAWLETLRGDTHAIEITIDDPTKDWYLQHNLNKQFPTVNCYDDDGYELIGEIQYYSKNLAIVHFTFPLSGKAVIK